MNATNISATETFGENFIPFRHRALIERLVNWLSAKVPVDENRLDALFHSLVTVFHLEHQGQLVALEDLYEPFDPDHDPNNGGDHEPSSEDTNPLFAELSRVLAAAHYHQLNQTELNQAVKLGWHWGVHLSLDFSIFQRLEVFARGYRRIKKKRRRLANFFRLEEVEFPEFHRLVLAFQLKEAARVSPAMQSGVVYLKIFKNIPENELEILLPGSTIKLSLIDRGKILIPSLSGAALAIFKVTRGAMILTIFTLSAFYNWLLFGAVLGFYLIRGLLSYLRTKDKYQFGLTRNLYLKNLDNNLGVIYRLFREAEEQEVCETILVYCLLLPEKDGLSEGDLCERAPKLLAEFTGQQLAFDIPDAIEKLRKYRLATCDTAGIWRVLPLQQAKERLLEFYPQSQFTPGPESGV
ncbi:MAG: DUF3754 domain-containing protein [Pirellulaceae bacterium]|nr:DUF3754 domain-containing protein [Pirellulaceae bacterium]